MRDKSKVNFTGQLKADTMARLIKISGDKGLSKIAAIEFLIESYEDKPTVQAEPQIKPLEQAKPVVKPIASVVNKEIPKPAVKQPIKQTNKEPSMAELLKQSRLNNL